VRASGLESNNDVIHACNSAGNYGCGAYFSVIAVAVDLAEVRGLHSRDFGLGLEEGAGSVELLGREREGGRNI
jgi:hypothetical protein